MNILLIPYNWQHSTIAGGEVYLHKLAKYLLSKGHKLKAIVGSKEAYTDDLGIDCQPQGEGADIFKKNNEQCQWADVIITHLIGSSLGYNKSIQHRKPLIFIAHNNSVNYATRFGDATTTHVVYNSHNLQNELIGTFGHFNGFVLHPPMQPLLRIKNGTKITLINCNQNKGGHIFGEIARQLPTYKFLGVFGGYGDQIEAHLTNITYLSNGTNMQNVYADTQVLLILSEFESWSQVATEAMQSGIPVIAHPTPGIRENLGDAGIYCDRNNIDKIIQNLLYLIGNETAYWRQSEVVYQRAQWMAEKSAEELQRFDKWLNAIK